MEKIIKIALIEPVGGHGGMDYYDYGLAFGLGSNNIIVEYHTCSKTQIRKYENVITHRTFQNFWDKSKLLKLLLFLKYSWQAIKSAKNNKCNLVHLHFFSFSLPNFLVLFMLKLNNLKTIVTVHDVDSFHGSSNPLLQRLSYFLMVGVIVHNESSFLELKKKGYNLPPIRIIPHGNYIPFVKKLLLPKNFDTVNLLFFGQIKEVKGLDILLFAFSKILKQNKNFKLIIAGRPWKTELGKYEKIIEDLGLSDYVETYFQYVPDEKIKELYKKAHLVVLPYRKIYQSGVLLLTMSYGRTVITSDLPAFKEIIIDKKNGFLFKAESSDDLAETILNISNKQIENCTQEAHDLIQTDYDWVKIGAKTKEFYKKLI
jgi:D-inositol-3-phosphate glycosyltransferase